MFCVLKTDNTSAKMGAELLKETSVSPLLKTSKSVLPVDHEQDKLLNTVIKSSVFIPTTVDP